MKAIEKARREGGKELTLSFRDQQDQQRKRDMEARKRAKDEFEPYPPPPPPALLPHLLYPLLPGVIYKNKILKHTKTKFSNGSSIVCLCS